MNLDFLNFSINQINTVTGDLDGNTLKIKNAISFDDANNVDISIFPETAISGYMCGSLWDRIDFTKDQVDKLLEIRDHAMNIHYHGVIVIGYIKSNGVKRNGFPKLTNAVAVIHDGHVQVYEKQILADSDHHEDRKYFQAGEKTLVFDIPHPTIKGSKIKIGTPLCEDSWFTDHTRNIPEEMVNLGADLLIIPNQSYFYYGKQQKRRELFSAIAKNNNVPVITINAVGVGDILKNLVVFDGGSMVFNNKGQMLVEMPRFKETNQTFKYGLLKPISCEKIEKFDEITNAIIFEQQEFFRLCGLKKAQVHVSGGLDSAIVAALVVKAMGAENSIFISNPSSLNTKSKDYVNYISDKLSVKMYWQPIQTSINEIIESDKIHMVNACDAPILSSAAMSSAHAVLRTVLGLMDTHRFGSGIVSTGNHTEIVLGWASFHDIGSIGVHAIIGDLTKVELYQLADYINDVIFGDDVIPRDLYDGKFKPAAELPDANEDPIDYWVQSGICAALIRERQTQEELIQQYLNHTLSIDLFPKQDEVYKYNVNEFNEQIKFATKSMKRSVYKAAQGSPIVIISPRSRGFSNRETLINYYNK